MVHRRAFRSRGCFHPHRSVSPIDRPLKLAPQVHPSMQQLLFRVTSLQLTVWRLSAQTACRGFRPLHDITDARPPKSRKRPFEVREVPNSPRFVPSSGFPSLSTACSALRLAGLFHPTAMFRVRARSGVCSLRTATLAHREELAPLPLLRP